MDIFVDINLPKADGNRPSIKLGMPAFDSYKQKVISNEFEKLTAKLNGDNVFYGLANE